MMSDPAINYEAAMRARAEFLKSHIYRRLQIRCRSLGPEWDYCPVSAKELEDLETACPAYMRWLHQPSGDFSCGIWSWRFRAVTTT